MIFGPGDVWACPRVYRFILETENVGETIFDPGQKLIVYTLPSIWQYPFFQNDITIPVFCQNRLIKKIGFVCIVLPIVLPTVLPIGLGLARGAKGPGPDRLGFGLGGQGS